MPCSGIAPGARRSRTGAPPPGEGTRWCLPLWRLPLCRLSLRYRWLERGRTSTAAPDRPRWRACSPAATQEGAEADRQCHAMAGRGHGGLLLPGERKSVETMAARLAADNVGRMHQSLQHVVAEAPWSDEAVLNAAPEGPSAGDSALREILDHQPGRITTSSSTSSSTRQSAP